MLHGWVLHKPDDRYHDHPKRQLIQFTESTKAPGLQSYPIQLTESAKAPHSSVQIIAPQSSQVTARPLDVRERHIL